MARGMKRAHAAEEDESVEEEEEEEVEEESGAEGESDGKDSDDDGSSNDEDVALDMAEEPGTAQELQVEFGFFDPRPEDYHHFKALLQAGSFWRGTEWDTPGLATLLSEQASVGTVIKADEDVFGFMSVVSLQFHREQPCVQQLTSHIMQRTGSAKATATLKALLAPSAKPVGLILSEWMLNTPHALIPSAVDSLMQDVAWAVENEVDEAHRASFKFDRLLLLAQVAPPSSTDADSPGASSSRQGRKGKRAKESPLEPSAFEFARAEEDVLAQLAESSYLLTGPVRHLLLVLEPSAVRDAVPSLHAVMGVE